MITGERWFTSADAESLFEQWRKNIPGGPEHIKHIQFASVTPPGFEPKRDDESQQAFNIRFEKATKQAMLVAWGDAIYPPARHSLKLLATDPPVGGLGARFGLTYNNETNPIDSGLELQGKHFSQITGETVQPLVTALTNHIKIYAVQDRVTGFLGLMYSALPRRTFTQSRSAEYSFSQSVTHKSLNPDTPKDDLFLQGHERPVTEIARLLNRKFGKDAGWKPLTPVPCASNETDSIIPVPVTFFENPEHMRQLEEVVKSLSRPARTGGGSGSSTESQRG